ncbi:MAG: PfkB family carbohydrate kinase, partial [Pseudomonadota bacterium]
RPLAAVGSDFSRSAFEQLERWRIDTEGLLSSDGPSARAFVFTDPASGAQLTTFYPMRTPDPKRPKDRAQILTHYREQLARSRASQVAVLPAEEAWQTLACEVFETIELRLWNPGQFVEHLSEEGARRLWDWANLVVLNAHEWEVLQGKLSSPAGRALIISDGAAPVRIRCADPSMQIPDCPIPVEDGSPAADPTGCGDALLAGVLAHLSAADAPILRQLESAAALTAATTAGIQLAQQALRQRGAVGYPPPRKS